MKEETFSAKEEYFQIVDESGKVDPSLFPKDLGDDKITEMYKNMLLARALDAKDMKDIIKLVSSGHEGIEWFRELVSEIEGALNGSMSKERGKEILKGIMRDVGFERINPAFGLMRKRHCAAGSDHGQQAVVTSPFSYLLLPSAGFP